MSVGGTKKLQRLETTNELLRLVILCSIIFLILYLTLIFGPIMLLILLLISGLIMALCGDFLESRQKTEKKVGICILCGQKLSINKKLCSDCLKNYDVIKLNQLQLRFIS
ncbi:MAG: hypothetical protein Q6362_008815 [Candidatus Wukongarchaeota archaeon]|nr:hypothetical protein [Candidatus Wukongarchaeota archaeon]MDO8129514.1 hypothetical protein [Candidatus Wukongarchaeota archaeon]